MKVWCVFDAVEWEGSFLASIHATEESAQQEADRLNADKDAYHGYYAEEWEVSP